MNQKCSNSVGYKKWLWGYPIEVTCRILWLKGQGYNIEFASMSVFYMLHILLTHSSAPSLPLLL